MRARPSHRYRVVMPSSYHDRFLAAVVRVCVLGIVMLVVPALDFFLSKSTIKALLSATQSGVGMVLCIGAAVAAVFYAHTCFCMSRKIEKGGRTVRISNAVSRLRWCCVLAAGSWLLNRLYPIVVEFSVAPFLRTAMPAVTSVIILLFFAATLHGWRSLCECVCPPDNAQCRRVFGLGITVVIAVLFITFLSNVWDTVEVANVMLFKHVSPATPLRSWMSSTLPLLYWPNSGVIAIGIAGVLARLLQVLGRIESDPARCSKCGYELAGISTGRCPECGTQSKSNEQTG